MVVFPEFFKKDHCAAVVDIGTSSAAVAVMQLEGNKPSIVLASHRIFLNSASREKKNLSAAVIALVKDAGTKVKSLLEKNPDFRTCQPQTLFIFARAPWSHSSTRRIAQRFSTDTKITSALIDAQSKELLSEMPDIDVSRLLEASVTRVEVNGYPTPRPIGKRGTMLTTTILASDIDTNFKTAISEASASLFPGAKSEWRTHTRAIMTLLRDHPQNFRDVVVVDIATENTDFIVVRDGVIAQQVTVNEGAHKILARVSPRSMPEETLSLLRMFERDQCASDACQVLKESLGKAEIELVRAFAEPLGKIALTGRLPAKMLLFTIPDMAPWFSRFFSRIDFSQFTLTAQPFATSIVNGQSLQQWVTTSSGVAVDVSLSLACALVHIEHAARKIK